MIVIKWHFLETCKQLGIHSMVLIISKFTIQQIGKVFKQCKLSKLAKKGITLTGRKTLVWTIEEQVFFRRKNNYVIELNLQSSWRELCSFFGSNYLLMIGRFMFGRGSLFNSIHGKLKVLIKSTVSLYFRTNFHSYI